MKQTFLMFQRGTVYYYEDTRNGEQRSLRTRNKSDAQRLINAKNESVQNPAAVNLQIGRTYIAASSPEMLTRTWKTVFDAMLPAKTGSTQERWDRVGKDTAYDLVWERIGNAARRASQSDQDRHDSHSCIFATHAQLCN